MKKSNISEIIKDIKSGKMVIIVDDESRENEGDLICAADLITPEIINFMASKGKGCLLYTSPSPRDRTRSRMPSSA